MTTEVTLIVLVGLSAAVVLTVAYAVGDELPLFTRARLVATYLGFAIVCTAVPLAVYFFPTRGLTLAKLVLALAIFGALALLLGLPKEHDGS